MYKLLIAKARKDKEMTEEQKKLFMEWLDKLVDITKSLLPFKYANIEGLDKYTGACGIDNWLQLDDKAFSYAVECLTPEIIEKMGEKYIQRSFNYKGLMIVACFDKEEIADE